MKTLIALNLIALSMFFLGRKAEYSEKQYKPALWLENRRGCFKNFREDK